jgi:AmmeMemoRadiSam system protein A
MSVYTEIAKQTIEAYVREGRTPGPEDFDQSNWPAELSDRQAGAFVTLHIGEHLRGCIGTISPTRPTLAEEIIRNAVQAATRDPRFSAVRADELDQLSYSVDVLGEPEPVSDPALLDPRTYGVIVSSGFARGLLLPDLEGVDTVDQQLSIALRKAGIPADAPFEIRRFRVERHGEGDAE